MAKEKKSLTYLNTISLPIIKKLDIKILLADFIYSCKCQRLRVKM